MGLTVVRVVHVDDPIPAVVPHGVDDGLVVVRPHADGKVEKAGRRRQDLLREPGRDKWHLERVAVRVQRVEGIRRDGSEHGEYAAGKLITYCKRNREGERERAYK